MSVYPVVSPGKFGETEVGYDLNVRDVFFGTPQEALEELSYSTEAVGSGTGIANRIDTFNFPHYSVDSQTWEANGDSLTFDFGPKISDIDADKNLRKMITKNYKEVKIDDIGQGGTGLE